MPKKKEVNVEDTLREKEEEIRKLRGDIEILHEEVEWARGKLADAQTHIRKLNWMLQQHDGELDP